MKVSVAIIACTKLKATFGKPLEVSKKKVCSPFHLQCDICTNAELNLADVS